VQDAVDAWNEAAEAAVDAYNAAAQRATDTFNQAAQQAAQTYNAAERSAMYDHQNDRTTNLRMDTFVSPDRMTTK
jgi:hypothetical protein